MFISAPSIAKFYDMLTLSPALRVLGIRIIVTSVNSVQKAYASRYMFFKQVFWSTFFSATLIFGVIGVYWVYHGFGVCTLVAQ